MGWDHPDEYGLSADSLRGSVEHIKHALVSDTPKGKDALGNDMIRDPLTPSEIEALRQRGVFLESDGTPITDWETIEKIAPPNYLVAGNMQGAFMGPSTVGNAPTGGWVVRNGEWMYIGDTPPPVPPSMLRARQEAQNIESAASNPRDDPATHFAQRIKETTKPFLGEKQPTPDVPSPAFYSGVHPTPSAPYPETHPTPQTTSGPDETEDNG